MDHVIAEKLKKIFAKLITPYEEEKLNTFLFLDQFCQKNNISLVDLLNEGVNQKLNLSQKIEKTTDQHDNSQKILKKTYKVRITSCKKIKDQNTQYVIEYHKLQEKHQYKKLSLNSEDFPILKYITYGTLLEFETETHKEHETLKSLRLIKK